jgi:hypothetical protein
MDQAAQKSPMEQSKGPAGSVDTPPPGYDLEERSFFDRIGDEVRSWFGDEEADRRRQYDEQMHHRYIDAYRLGFSPPGGAAGMRGFGPMTYPHSRSGANRPTTGYVEHDREFDVEYQVWRERQMAALDRDYDEYRREKQQRFDENFGSWREKRSAQLGRLDNVTEHMEVVGSDGKHVGTVDCVRGDQVTLTRSDPDAGGMHHSIPATWIEQVEDRVMLNIPALQAKAEWKNAEE